MSGLVGRKFGRWTVCSVRTEGPMGAFGGGWHRSLGILLGRRNKRTGRQELIVNAWTRQYRVGRNWDERGQ